MATQGRSAIAMTSREEAGRTIDQKYREARRWGGEESE